MFTNKEILFLVVCKLGVINSEMEELIGMSKEEKTKCLEKYRDLETYEVGRGGSFHYVSFEGKKVDMNIRQLYPNITMHQRHTGAELMFFDGAEFYSLSVCLKAYFSEVVYVGTTAKFKEGVVPNDYKQIGDNLFIKWDDTVCFEEI